MKLPEMLQKRRISREKRMYQVQSMSAPSVDFFDYRGALHRIAPKSKTKGVAKHLPHI